MNRLQAAAGFNYQQAKVLYGVYGKAQTLFNLPAAFITPLTISIVPAIAAALARGDKHNASLITEDSLRISSFISIPMGVGLCVMSQPIMDVLYPGSHQAGPVLLGVMGIASFFVCIVLMQNAILVSSGREKLTMLTLISGSVLKIVINWFLVAQPEINIYGAPVGTLVSYFYMASLNYFFMCKTLDRRPRLLRIFSGSVAASLLMGLSAWAVYGLASRFVGVDSWFKIAVCMCMGVGVAVIVYLVSAICLKAITNADMKLIPGGEKVAKLLHIH
jgi:stage V sporulation protein B